jgi:Cu-processing system permease protein
MSTLLPLLRLSAREAVRGRWLIGISVMIAVAGELLLRFSGGGATTLVSLIDVVLIATPLVGLVAGTVQVHHARDLTELLLAQPVSRRRLFLGLYLGSAGPLAVALCLGLLGPFLWHGMLGGELGARLTPVLAATVGLTFISTALAFLIALRIDDRVRALGVALAAWLVAAVVWDGAILLVAMLFGDRSVEGVFLGMLALNPLDLARVLLLLGTDAAALLGYTGAVLQHVLGTNPGRAALIATLGLWLVVPLGVAARAFQRKNF